MFGWILLYEYMNFIIAGKSILTAACMESLYVSGFVVWIRFSGQNQKIRMQKVVLSDWRTCIGLVPVLFLPICNIVYVGMGDTDIFALIYIFDIVMVEEVLFRGFLLSRFLKSGQRMAILSAAFVFGMFHFVNLSQISDWKYVFFQSVCACIVGIYYNEITLKYNSLLPGIAAHFLVNVTGMHGSLPVADLNSTVGYGLCMVLYIITEVIFYRKIKVIKIKDEEKKDGILY